MTTAKEALERLEAHARLGASKLADAIGTVAPTAAVDTDLATLRAALEETTTLRRERDEAVGRAENAEAEHRSLHAKTHRKVYAYDAIARAYHLASGDDYAANAERVVVQATSAAQVRDEAQALAASLRARAEAAERERERLREALERLVWAVDHTGNLTDHDGELVDGEMKQAMTVANAALADRSPSISCARCALVSSRCSPFDASLRSSGSPS